MSASAVAIHVVTESTASLLDYVDDDVFDHPVKPALLREFLASPSNVLVVAVVDAKVVGMATGMSYVHPDKPLSLFINEVGVSSKHLRRGIGTRLVSAILDWGRERGCLEAWVATEVGNEAARSLYRSTGGKEDDEQAVVYVYSLAHGRAAERDA